jgi:glycosyltransferase involved in cell wall biosynthesis
MAFARHLQGSGLAIANGQDEIPVDASLDWLAEHFPAHAFDAVHIHTTELARLDAIESCIAACRKNAKAIVATLHEDSPLFDLDHANFNQRLQLLRQARARFATLTDGCRQSLCDRYGFTKEEIEVIPHGNVLALDSPLWDFARSSNLEFTFTIHGGFRPNKRLYDAVVHFAYAPTLVGARLSIMTRAFSLHELLGNPDLKQVAQLSRQAHRIELSTRASISDADIARFVSNGDAMILPYIWGTHSGQLELAADTGVLPIVTDVGHYRDQVRINGMGEQNVIWVDWPQESPFGHAAAMLEALEQALQVRYVPTSRRVLLSFRKQERQEILAAYARLYAEARDAIVGTGAL